MNYNRFILCSNCIPVKGASRSGIADLQNNIFHFIPNGLYDILIFFNGRTIDEIKAHYNFEFDEFIDEYFDFLFSNQLIIFTTNPKYFPKLNLKWHSPSIITNAIIDYDSIEHDFKAILNQLDFFKCSFLQLRFFSIPRLDYIESLLLYIDDNKLRFRTIEIILPYKKLNFERLKNIINNNPRIFSIIAFSSPKEKIFKKRWKIWDI